MSYFLSNFFGWFIILYFLSAIVVTVVRQTEKTHGDNKGKKTITYITAISIASLIVFFIQDHYIQRDNEVLKYVSDIEEKTNKISEFIYDIGADAYVDDELRDITNDFDEIYRFYEK